MIRIIADIHHAASPPAGVQHISCVADYVNARRAVRTAIDNGQDVTLYVTDPIVVQWLSDLRRYPATLVAWREQRSETTFEQLFGAPPMPPFTSDLLTALDLETLTPPPIGSKVDPVAFMLSQRLDPVWGYVEPPNGHFERVVAWAAPQRNWLPGPYLPLIAHQLERWTASDARFAALRADALPGDAGQVLARSTLARYDASWHATQPWVGRPEIALEGREPLAIAALRPLHTQIKSYWNERCARADDALATIEQALEQASGLSVAEVDTLVWMIKRQPESLTADLLARIERRFARLPEAAEQLTRLREGVAPDLPALPDLAWSDGRWLRWATGEYMPYFAWVLRATQPRDHQITCAERFADWVYERYPHWLNDDDAPLARRQHGQLRDLLDRDSRTVVVWVVLDGMAWWHGDQLRTLSERQGLYAQEHMPAIAALPSITRIAKRALVTGMSTTDIEQPTIAAAARTHFARIGVAAHVTYRLHEALDTLHAGDLRCVLVLDNTIDELAHQNRDFTDTLAIRGHLETVAVMLGQARQICAEQGRMLRVLIGSDHGGTLLPDDATGIAPPRSVKPVEEIWEGEQTTTDVQKHSPRAATLDDIGHIPADERARWYVLDRDQFQLERHYLAPRGYAYLKPRPSGWTHGGLAPEELLVPLLHLAPEPPQIEPPQIAIEGSLRPRQASLVTLTLVNTNRFPLEQLALTIDGVEYTRIELLNGTTSMQFELTLPSVTTQEVQTALEWRVEFQAFGVAHMHAGQVILAVRRLSVDTSDFDDMFGDL
ncbi:MAG TPA: hypothetical protein VFS21_25160 [Roseiflexaceae bacterium]|nr:hypothetical protein [Roseiflexaceae bacterium]